MVLPPAVSARRFGLAWVLNTGGPVWKELAGHGAQMSPFPSILDRGPTRSALPHRGVGAHPDRLDNVAVGILEGSRIHEVHILRFANIGFSTRICRSVGDGIDLLAAVHGQGDEHSGGRVGVGDGF